MDIITVDIETYYDREYSLSKITTEAYIRDPRFEPIGIAVKVNDNPAQWYSGDDFPGFLAQFDWANAGVVCHNTPFDGAILSWRYGIKPKFWFDTLSMARPFNSVLSGLSLKNLSLYYGLGEKGDEVFNAIGKHLDDFSPSELVRYSNYCINDVELTYRLFKVLRLKLPVSELMVIDTAIRMFTEPVIELDPVVLREHLSAEITRKEQLLQNIIKGAQSADEAKAIIMSNPKFAEALRALEVEPPVKISARTGKETYAFGKTDKGLTALLEHDDPDVVALVEARLGVKSTIEQTRTERLLAVQQRGSLPVMLNYYAAHTGRFGGGDKMNLQNLPRGSKEKPSKLRGAIRAPKGKVIVACDSSQIEARVLAWLAEQRDLLKAFREKRDVYSEFASIAYERKITKDDKEERFVGKTCILGLGYGMGWMKLQRTLELGNGGVPVHLSPDECQRLVRIYRNTNYAIRRLWERCDRVLNDMAMGRDGTLKDGLITYTGSGTPRIILPNGLPISYPVLTVHNHGWDHGWRYINNSRSFQSHLKAKLIGEDDPQLFTFIYGAKTTENLVQALARIVVSEQMVKIRQRYHTALQVHDEIVCVVDESVAQEARDFMVETMSAPPVWAPDLPVSCEAGMGVTYADAK